MSETSVAFKNIRGVEPIDGFLSVLGAAYWLFVAVLQWYLVMRSKARLWLVAVLSLVAPPRRSIVGLSLVDAGVR